MLRIVQDRVVTPRQEGRRKRNIVESACAGFGRQIHFESSGGQHFVRMKSLYEEHACLVATGINGAIEARNGNQGLSGKFSCHRFFPYRPHFWLVHNWRLTVLSHGPLRWSYFLSA